MIDHLFPLTPERLRQVLVPAHTPLPPLEGHPAAVLLLLYPRDGEMRFVLTLRQPHLTRHAGQVSLPGGASDPTDADLWETAIRETREEIGADLENAIALGRLDTEIVQATGYSIVPFVAWVPSEPALQANEEEVAQIVTVPISDLCDPRNVAQEVWTLRGAPYAVVLYRFGSLAVWGATARVLSRFAERLGCALDPPPGAVWPAGR